MLSLLESSAKPSRERGELPPLLLRLTNFLGYLFLILVNILSSTGAFGGTNGEVSSRFPTPLTPAGWAFSIWGVIFALEGAGVVYQILNSGYREGGWKTSVVVKIGYGWQLGWLSQDLWQFLFVQESVPGMWLAALALIAALAAFQFTLYRLNGTTRELRARGYATMPAPAYIFYKLPTSINAAWLSVATALGLLIIPVSYGVAQSRLVAPAAVLAVAVTAGGVWRMAFHRDAAYGLTLIWALSAVAANRSSSVPLAVKVVGIVCLAILALFVVAALVRTHRERSSDPRSADGSSGGFMRDSYSLYGSYSPYGPYTDRRGLLSDSDALAGGGGAGTGSDDGNLFAEEGGRGFQHGGLGRAGEHEAGRGGAGGRPSFGGQAGAPAAQGLAAAWGAQGLPSVAPLQLTTGPAAAGLATSCSEAQEQQQQQPVGVSAASAGDAGGSRRQSLNGTPAAQDAASVGPGPRLGLAWGQPVQQVPMVGNDGGAPRKAADGAGGVAGAGAGGGRRVRFQLDEEA